MLQPRRLLIKFLERVAESLSICEYRNISGRPLLTYLLIPYLLIAFCFMSLIFNSLYLKIYRCRAVSPEHTFSRSRGVQKVSCMEDDRTALMVKDETFSELREMDSFDESIISSYHTVGIFQIEVSLTHLIRLNNSHFKTKSPTSKNDQGIQAGPNQVQRNPQQHFFRPISNKLPHHRYSFAGRSSHDDVQSLLQETYRPPKTAK